MSHVISEFIKRKLSRGKKDEFTRVDTCNELEESKDAGHHNRLRLQYNSLDTDLNSIQEESCLSEREDTITGEKMHAAVPFETTEEKTLPNTFYRLQKRVISLPDFHKRAFPPTRDITPSRSREYENTPEMVSSDNSVEMNNGRDKSKAVFHKSKKEVKCDNSIPSLSRKDILFSKLKIPSDTSLNSNPKRVPRSRSSSYSQNRLIPILHSNDDFTHENGNAIAYDFLTSDYSGISLSSPQQTDYTATIRLPSELSTDLHTGKPLHTTYLCDADEARKRSRTVGASEMLNHLDTPEANISSSGVGRVRSNSCNSGPFLNRASTPKSFSLQQSRRRGSFVTSLTNFVSLKSMTLSTMSKPSVPTQISFEELKKPPKPKESDDTHTFLSRIVPVYQKYVALVLCSRPDEMLFSCMNQFLDNEFRFYGEPLDISLRKVVLFLELPKESQQIDRLLRAFSNVYFSQNMRTNTEVTEKFWIDPEHIFSIVYSLLILHTDTFNPNNKEKLTKEQFLKLVHTDSESNTKHIPREYFEYLFDNITSREFPQVLLPPYQVAASTTPELDNTEYWFLEGYSPKALIDDRWLANRKKLLFKEKQNALGSQYLHPPHQFTVGSSSSTPSIVSLSLNDDLDPYFHIVNDSVESIQLAATGNQKMKTASINDSFEGIPLRKALSIFSDIKGGYVKFKKAYISSITERNNYEVLLADDSSEFAYFKIIRMDEIEVKVNTKKFSIVGNNSKSHWKTKFVILTTSFLIYFDDMVWVNPISEYDEKTGITNYIIDFSGLPDLRYEIDKCSDLFVVGTDNERILTIFNQNTKLEVLLASKSDAVLWKRMIYFAGSLQGCFFNINGIPNTLISERKITIEDKLSKLSKNLEASIAKVESLNVLYNFYMQTSPIMAETRSMLTKQVDSICNKIDMLQYHLERIRSYMFILTQILEIIPDIHTFPVSDTDSIDQSFIFNRDSGEW